MKLYAWIVTASSGKKYILKTEEQLLLIGFDKAFILAFTDYASHLASCLGETVSFVEFESTIDLPLP